MTAGGVFFVLGGALLHGGWDLLFRRRAGRFWFILVMGGGWAGGAVSLTFLFGAAGPGGVACIGVLAFLQICYCLVLVRAYSEGELGSIYPIARGSSPMLVTLGALVFAGEKLGPLALFGVAMVSFGIVGMTFGRGRPNVSSIVA